MPRSRYWDKPNSVHGEICDFRMTPGQPANSVPEIRACKSLFAVKGRASTSCTTAAAPLRPGALTAICDPKAAAASESPANHERLRSWQPAGSVHACAGCRPPSMRMRNWCSKLLPPSRPCPLVRVFNG